MKEEDRQQCENSQDGQMKAEMGGDVSEKVRLGLGVTIPAAVKLLKDGVEGRSSRAAGIKVIKRKPGSRKSQA